MVDYLVTVTDPPLLEDMYEGEFPLSEALHYGDMHCAHTLITAAQAAFARPLKLPPGAAAGALARMPVRRLSLPLLPRIRS